MASGLLEEPRPFLGPNLLDVLENALGARPIRSEMERLSVRELENLRELLGELWSAQHDEPAGHDAYLIGGWMGAFWSTPTLRTDLSDSLLYYPNLLVLDPLADFFAEPSEMHEMRGIRYRRPDGQYNVLTMGPAMWSQQATFPRLRDAPAEAAAQFAAVVSNLYELEHLIKSGVVVVRSQWPTLRQRAQQLITSVRHDVKSSAMQAFVDSSTAAGAPLPVWDNLRGARVEMDLPVHGADAVWRNEPVFYYLAKTLAVADAAGAQYVPAEAADLDLLRLKVNSGIRQIHPGAFLREVTKIVAPSVDVPIARAVEIRASSENFEDWRRALRQLRRTTGDATGEELAEQVRDELQPRLHAVARELKGSREVLRDEGAAMLIDTVVGGGVAIATQDVLTGVAATASSGLLRWLYRAYAREEPGGSNAVLATLIRDRK